VVSEQAALDRFFQCMSPTRSEYNKLGLELVSLEDNRSRTPKKPSMAEEKKIDGADDPISLLLEQALTRQRDEMMENFSHILQRLPIASGASSSSDHFGGTSPFKVQVNFDIPVFEGQIDADALDKWLNLLEGYFSVHNFSEKEKITFALLKALPHVKHWWETYWEQSSTEESGIYGAEPTWDFFMDAVKEQYYPVGNYEEQYMRWTTLRQERGQAVPEFTNTFHTLRTKLGIKDSERHLVLKYRGALHRYIQTEMDFLDISSLGAAYRYAVKIEQKFKHQNKREFGSANPQQPKYDKDVPNKQSPENQSKTQEKKGHGKTKKDTGKWCDFHKSPWHNTDECRSKQSLVAEIKDKEPNPDSESDSENNGKRQIIDADPTAIVATAAIQPEEPTDPEEGERLFHSQMWVKGTPLHFIVDSGSQKNLISAEVVKQLGLSTTPHPQPYSIGWLRQGRDLRVSQQCRLSYGIQPFKDEVLCDVAPLDVCDVLLGQPYMWKHHAIYESRPRSVIITLGGHLYRIPEVVPTTAPPKKCCKVVSHTRKFIFSTICSKGEQKDTAATTASAKAPSIQQKQVDKVAEKHEDSFCKQSSKIARLVKMVQTFQPQVRDRFPQTKQRDFSSKTSSSPRCRFNKCFSVSPGNSTQWRPLLPKEGGLIQVDIGGHPPFPNGSKQFSGHFGNLLFLAGFNFRGLFEGPNEGFSRSRFSMIAEGMIEAPK
jgi:hypothetical protein